MAWIGDMDDETRRRLYAQASKRLGELNDELEATKGLAKLDVMDKIQALLTELQKITPDTSPSSDVKH